MSKIHPILVFIIILTVVIVLPTNAFAPDLHDRTLREVIEGPEPDESKRTFDIGVVNDTLYLLRDGGSISVISAENYTKIGEDIRVGGEEKWQLTLFQIKYTSSLISILYL